MDIPKKSKEVLSKTNRSSLLKLLNKKKPCLNTFKDERMKTNNNTLLSISITILFTLLLQSSFY
jgi:hypothetical protein